MLYPVVSVGPLPVLDCLLDGGLNRIILMITGETLYQHHENDGITRSCFIKVKVKVKKDRCIQKD